MTSRPSGRWPEVVTLGMSIQSACQNLPQSDCSYSDFCSVSRDSDIGTFSLQRKIACMKLTS